MSKMKLVILFLLVVGPVGGLVLPWTWAQVGQAVSQRDGVKTLPDRPRAEVQKGSTAAREVGTVFFRVVDQEAKQPLSGVILKVWVDGKIDGQFTTDASGRIVIPMPRKAFNHLTVTARKDGLAPRKIQLRQAAAPEIEIPRSYTLVMAHSTSIGGIVRDEEGHPIEGVVVVPYETSPRDRARESIDLNDVSVRTDREGRWHIDLIPEGYDLGDLQWTFSHPDFVGSSDSSRFQPNATPKELRSQSGVTVLYRAVSVTGRVLNREGHPIAGASVRLGARFGDPTVKTGADGRFRFRNAPARERSLTVEAAGHAPETMSVRVHDGLPPIEFRLGPGRTIRGRVLDSQGRPLANAHVSASRWRGLQNLDWRSRTDSDGRFTWDGAPSDRVVLAAFKEGFRTAELSIEPSDKEAVLRLTPTSRLRIRGTVTDAVTGRPIESFTVVPNVEPGGILMLEEARTHHGGRYVFSDAQNGQPYRVRIEAKGYLPAVSPAFPHDAGEQVFNVRLGKGRWVEGVVRRHDGSPLSGTEVILVSGNGISIDGGRTYQRQHHPHLLTGPDGRFAFSPPGGDCRIIALHDRGYAEATAQQLDEVDAMTIEPWGRIEGSLRVGGRALAHETIVVNLEEERTDSLQMRIQNSSRVATDEQGRFVLDRLPPGEARAFWQPERHGARRQPDRYYRPAFVNVRPGQTARLDLVEAGGPPLLGRIVVSDEKGQPLDPMNARAYLETRLPDIPYPADLTDQERQEWLHGWRLTEAGKTYRHRRRGFGHVLDLQPDGSFRVDEVQPGDYVLHVRVEGFAELVHTFSIPEPAAGQAGRAVDLGALSPKR